MEHTDKWEAPYIDFKVRPADLSPLCNLYRMTSSTAEIANLFGASQPDAVNVAAEIYPGYPGLVVADGHVRRMTRTWYAMPGGKPFAVAGLGRATAKWGDAYAIVIVDSCPDMADVHDRMPVVLPRSAWERWTSSTPEDAFGLCQPWNDGLLVERTQDRWAAPQPASRATKPSMGKLVSGRQARPSVRLQRPI